MNNKFPVIAVVTASANHYTEKEIIKGVIDAAQKMRYHTAVFSNIYNFRDDGMELMCEHRIYELIRSEDINAIVVITESFGDVRLKQMIAGILIESDIPVVAVGSRLPEFSEPRCVCINTDDVADMEKLTSHLIEEHGFRNIDLITGPVDSDISVTRKNGYINSLIRHGIVPDEEKIHYGDFWFSSGDALAQRYISGDLPLPQAIICASSHMAYALLNRFIRSGIKVPQQVSVVSYEYNDERILYTPLLTSLKRNRSELGKKAVEILDCMLHGVQPPDFIPPTGDIIYGESCPCRRNDAQYMEDLMYAQQRNNQIFFTTFNTMEQKFIDCRSIDEFACVTGEHQWMIRNVQTMYLCMFSEWYDTACSSSKTVTCRCVTPWKNNAPFETQKLSFTRIFSEAEDPAAYYFVPIFFRTHLMGHIILQYGEPDGYDDFFRNWLSSLSLALEYLRMRNDLKYLLKCQNLSETRNTLTGLYTEKGMRYVYNAINEISGKELFMVILKICLSEDSFGNIQKENKISAVNETAAIIKQFCGAHNIPGHFDENTFVCMFQTTADAPAITDALSSLLLQCEVYIRSYGVDSFVCSAVQCLGKSFDDVFGQCIEEVYASETMLKERRKIYRYRQLLELRNRIYLSPLKTSDSAEIPSVFADKPDSFRHSYKKCFGISFHKDRINARIAKAKHLLITTSMNINKIAEMCGYLDTKHFMHQFSQLTSTTPTGYRKLFSE